MTQKNRKLSALDSADALDPTALLYAVQAPETNPKSVKMTLSDLTQWHGGLLKAGDNMAGDLTLARAPTNPLHAATKAYVDAVDANAAAALTGALATLQAADTALSATKMAKDSNLSDLTDPEAARTNLGLSASGSSLIAAADYAAMKALLDLGEVNNTPDQDKPISSVTQAALDTKQPLNANLNAIASLAGGSGILKKTAANTWALDATTFLSSTDIGSAVQGYDADVAALAANSTSGLWARTGAGAGAARTLTGTANEISVTNGDGVAGAPTFSLPAALTFTAKTVVGGKFTAIELSGTTTLPGSGQITSGGDFLVGAPTSSWAHPNRRVVEVNGAIDALVGLKVSDAQRAYFYATADQTWLNSGGPLTIQSGGLNYVAIEIGSVERLRVDSAGNVGIGTNTPMARLHVATTTNFMGGTNFQTPHFFLRAGNDAAGNVTRFAMGVGNGAQVYLDSVSDASAYATFLLRTRGPGGVAERLSIAPTGEIDAKGMLSISSSGGLPYAGGGGILRFSGGHASPLNGRMYLGDGTGWHVAFSKLDGFAVTDLFKFHDSGVVEMGGGLAAAVRFPATQLSSSGANDLDDYEEGTFTPSLRIGGDGTGITYLIQTGRYTKIGRQVTVEVCLILSNKGAAVGNAQVFGLPFAAIAALPSGIGAVVTNQMTGVSAPACGSQQGSTAIGLYQNATGAYLHLNNTNLTNTSELYLTLTCTTA